MYRTILLTSLWATLLNAQTPPGGRGNASPPIISCDVKADHTVTFRLRAAEATDVKVGGDFVQGAQPMAKGDDGVWTVTLGPLNPAIYSYTFRVNGVSILDPLNPMIQLGERSSSSMFEIPAEKPALYDLQDVPHGTVHINYYDSKSLGVARRVDVYTPPGYEHGK